MFFDQEELNFDNIDKCFMCCKPKRHCTKYRGVMLCVSCYQKMKRKYPTLREEL